jgi:hypothetical protein
VERQVLLEIPDGQNISFEYSAGHLAIESCLVSRHFNMRQESKKLVISDWSEDPGFSILEVNIQVLSKKYKTERLISI